MSATEKGTGKANNIQIKNDKGRLSNEDIERMVNEAERFKEHDDEQRKLLESRNELDATLSACNTMASQNNNTDVKKRLDEIREWLDTYGGTASATEIDEHLQAVREIQTELTAGAAAAGETDSAATGGEQEGDTGGPKVEEVD